MADIQVTVTEWGDVLVNSANEFATKIGDFLPTAIGALILFVVGLLVASLFKKVTLQLLSLKTVSSVIDNKKVREGLSKAGVEWTVAELLSKIIYWIVVLIFLMSISNILGLSVLADTIQRVIAYIPNIIGAVIIVAIAIAAARVVRDFVAAGLTTLQVAHTKVIGAVAEGIIVLFGVVMAFTQLGFDTTIITANVTLIVGGIVLAFALALGLGTKEMVRSMSVKHYAEKTFKKGDKITIGEHSGKVKDITNVGVILDTPKGDVVVPNSQLV